MTASAPPRPRRRTPLWAWALPLLSVMAAVAIPGLWYYGFSAVRDATDGTLQRNVTDPLAPGFEAIVEPSSTLLAFGTDEAGSLAWAAVLALGTADEGGSVLLVPPETLVFSVDGERPLAELFAESADLAVGGLAILSDMGFGAVEVLDPAQLASLVEPLGGVEMTLADPLVRVGAGSAAAGEGSAEGGEVVDGAAPEREVVRPAGSVTLDGAEFAEVLTWSNPGESPVNRLLRQEVAWTAWLEALAAVPDAALVLPGETDVGMVRFLRGLASGTNLILEVPGAPVAGDDGELYAADGAAVRALLLDMVPFPAPAFPGDRPRVRLLDGRPAAERLLSDASTLVSARAEIVIIGNASSFGREATVIEYHNEDAEQWARSLSDALGAGQVVAATSPEPVIDITVILGQDLA